MQSLLFKLPYPPSVNRYWRMWRGRMVISKEGIDYKHNVCKIVRVERPETLPFFNSRLNVCLDIFPPDRRRRDIDNCAKAVLDAMSYSGIYADDEQIDELLMRRKEVKKGGELLVCIKAIEQTLTK